MCHPSRSCIRWRFLEDFGRPPRSLTELLSMSCFWSRLQRLRAHQQDIYSAGKEGVKQLIFPQNTCSSSTNMFLSFDVGISLCHQWLFTWCTETETREASSLEEKERNLTEISQVFFFFFFFFNFIFYSFIFYCIIQH